jgi:hypothetical protein
MKYTSITLYMSLYIFPNYLETYKNPYNTQVPFIWARHTKVHLLFSDNLLFAGAHQLRRVVIGRLARLLRT